MNRFFPPPLIAILLLYYHEYSHHISAVELDNYWVTWPLAVEPNDAPTNNGATDHKAPSLEQTAVLNHTSDHFLDEQKKEKQFT